MSTEEKDPIFLGNPVALIGILLRETQAPLAEDFEAQLKAWEQLCEEKIDLTEQRYCAPPGFTHEVIEELLQVIKEPREIWFRDGYVHILTRKERVGRGWITGHANEAGEWIPDEDNELDG